MISVDEALQLVRQHTTVLPQCVVSIADALGRCLAVDMVSRVDSPPFDKSMVDGYAIDLSDDSPTLRVTELVTAGQVPQRRVESGTTIQVMTGAPTPSGAQAVIKWEDCERLDDQTIRNPRQGVANQHCIVPQGSSFRAGQVVLTQGKPLGPLDIALLAEIGQATAPVIRQPRVAVLATGDELVEAGQALAPGQIRNSNGPMLLAAAHAAGVESVNLGIARDDPGDLRARLGRGLECDVLLVSGGVSAGVKDLVPGILAELGAEQVFHKVRMKPGKPLWFGVRATGEQRSLVFGLPGNPVSTFVSYLLFVRPALRALAGGNLEGETASKGQLTASLSHRGGRPTYYPCRRCESAGPSSPALVEPLAWRGSSDLAALTKADCLAALPAGDCELPPGSEVEILPL